MDLEALQTLNYIYNESDIVLRLFLSFGITAVLAPWSIGITYFLILLVVYEMLFLWKCDHYPLIERVGIVFASYLGWLVGRYLVEETQDEDILGDVRSNAEWARSFF